MYLITIDPADYRPTMAELTATLTDLLAIAIHNRMPLPRYATVHGNGSIGLQLPPERDSIDAVRMWASAYCAAVLSQTCEGDNGPYVSVSTQFELDGVITVDVYAHVPVPETEPITSTEQDSDPETVTPF
jgi:hypothetical protein